MNTQEYRLKSAEALGIEVNTWKHFFPLADDQPGGDMLYYKNKHGAYPAWIPNEDANQMLMVWDWLRGEVQGKVFTKIVKAWFFQNPAPCPAPCPEPSDDIKLATAKAFMEYINQ